MAKAAPTTSGEYRSTGSWISMLTDHRSLGMPILEYDVVDWVQLNRAIADPYGYLRTTQAAVVPTVVEPPTFTNVAKVGDTIVLQWTGTGTLQSSDIATGGWTDVANAQSPYSAPTTGAAKFFRFKP